MSNPDILAEQKSNGHILNEPAVIVHGLFEEPLFDILKGRGITEVVLLEGRPDMSTSKVSSQQLLKRGIKPIWISDNMPGFLFHKDLVQEVWLAKFQYDHHGALCQIGGLILAVLGKTHGVPVFTYSAKGEAQLMGRPEDVLFFNKKRVAPPKTKAYVPLAEWVPAKYLTKFYE